MSQSCRAHLFFGAHLIQQNLSFSFCFLFFFFFFFCFFVFVFVFACLLAIFFQFFFFMTVLVKIYVKRYDKHNKTLWTTDFFNSVFCLVSCSSKNQVPYVITKKLWPTRIWHVCCSEKKKKKTLKQPYLGQVFQSVTSFDT